MQKNKYISSAFEALAAASSIATLLSFMFNIHFSICCGIITLVVIGLITLVYAGYQNRKIKTITIPINDITELTIEESDLFSGGDIIIVPVNEYFDVHVGDGVVDPNSIHGLFINEIWHGDAEDLYQTYIRPSLACVPNMFLETVDRDGWYCHSDKYKLGTCVDIQCDGKTYVLLALTHFDSQNHAYLTRTEYHDVLIDLMNHVNDIYESKTVCMPLLGTGLSRLQSKTIQILHYLIDCLRFECNKINIIGGLSIRIKSLDGAGIDLNSIKEVFKD